MAAAAAPDGECARSDDRAQSRLTGMKNLLYLVHRLPYPPNKGDKLRSFHLLQHLAARYRVHLGTFVDDARDEPLVDALRPFCASIHAERLYPAYRRVQSLRAISSGEALTVAYYRSAAMKRWAEATVRDERIDSAVVFCSAMSQFVADMPQIRVIADLVDVDSAKWAEYAGARRFPLSWLYRRESERLLACERAAVARSVRAFFVTDAEARLFVGLAPECADRIEAVPNGVDAAYFDPSLFHTTPYSTDELPIVFTGAMDYWPNVDAVRWFARDVLPGLRAAWPRLRFYIVGMRPAPVVKALAGPDVVVTGGVPDTRPYLQHAAVAVAPLKVARGIQNKVLEAMAMGRPIVASGACAAGVDAVAGRDLEVAADADAFVRQIDALLRDPGRAKVIGRAARERVLARYSWTANLSKFDRLIDAAPRPHAHFDTERDKGAAERSPPLPESALAAGLCRDGVAATKTRPG
jgi:sugar transferase (PEP-CTERM/EpsH1 system associated)